MERYWETIYDDIFEGVQFKFKKLNPIEHINLVTYNTKDIEGPGVGNELFIRKCAKYLLWSKDGSNWFPIVDDLDNSRLPELDENPSILLDLFCRFRKDVLVPVFLESKTYQSVLTETPKHKKN